MGGEDADPAVTHSYTHDARGNVTGNGRLSFVYDLSEQPVSVLRGGLSSRGAPVYGEHLII